MRSAGSRSKTSVWTAGRSFASRGPAALRHPRTADLHSHQDLGRWSAVGLHDRARRHRRQADNLSAATTSATAARCPTSRQQGLLLHLARPRLTTQRTFLYGCKGSNEPTELLSGRDRQADVALEEFGKAVGFLGRRESILWGKGPERLDLVPSTSWLGCRDGAAVSQVAGWVKRTCGPRLGAKHSCPRNDAGFNELPHESAMPAPAADEPPMSATASASSDRVSSRPCSARPMRPASSSNTGSRMP